MSWLSKATGIDLNLGKKKLSFNNDKGSVFNNPLNISPLHSGQVGSDVKIHEGGAEGITSKFGSAFGGNIFGGGNDKAMSSLSMGDVEKFMDKGEAKGELLTGATMEEVGQGRADVRDRLQEILQGNSAGANALQQDQAQQQKSLRAQQALAGGGQMNMGQQQALQRQASRDLSKFVSDERRQALSDISKEYRGAGGDIMKSTGQYGSILVGAQPPALPNNDGGFLGLGNLF